MSSNHERVKFERSFPSPPPPPSPVDSLSKEDNNSPSSFKLSIKREKTVSGEDVLTSEIINPSSSSLPDGLEEEEETTTTMMKKREEQNETTPSSRESRSGRPFVIQVFKKDEPKVETKNDISPSAAVVADGEGKGGGGGGGNLDVSADDDDPDASALVVEIGADSAVSGVSSEPLWMVGDVVWCLQRGNPWWPCLVTNEFNSDGHSRYVNSGSRTIKQYHVQFFGPKPLHAWIHENSVRPFNDRDEVAGWKERDVAVFKKMSKPRREKAMKAYQPTSKAIIIELDAAKDEADKATGMPVMERLDVFEFEYQSVGENSSEMTSDKRKVKFTPLKPGTTVVMMSAGGGGRVEPQPEVVKPTPLPPPSPPPPPPSPPPPAESSASGAATEAAEAAEAAALSHPPEPSSPPSKRRRTIGPVFHESGPSSFSPPSTIINNNNNNSVKVDNNNLPSMESNAGKPATIRYTMTPLGIPATTAIATTKAPPEQELFTTGDVSGVETSSSPDRNDAERDEELEEDAAAAADDADDNDDVYDDDDDEEDASPKDNPDIFSKFSLCHAAEMKSIHPELSPESIEAKLREQWDSMTDEEANWYIYNGVPPGKLLPGKKRPRPKKFLDQLCEEYNRRKNGSTA